MATQGQSGIINEEVLGPDCGLNLTLTRLLYVNELDSELVGPWSRPVILDQSIPR